MVEADEPLAPTGRAAGRRRTASGHSVSGTIRRDRPVARESGWPGLFWSCFKRSRNPMVVLDGWRRHVEVNGGYLQLLGYRRAELIGQPAYKFVAGGPLVSPREWHGILTSGDFTGTAPLVRADGGNVTVEYAAHPAVVTGRRLVLFVALNSTRRGRAMRTPVREQAAPDALSERERQIVRMIALGSSGPEIASELQVTHNTVRTHVRNAMVKLGARSRAHLVARSLGDGVVLR
jgi:PAS domain S-box-containing protein